MKVRNYFICLVFTGIGLLLPLFAYSQSSPQEVEPTRKSAIIRGSKSPTVFTSPEMGSGKSSRSKKSQLIQLKSTDETINHELFTLTVVYAILALVPLTILGVVAFNARNDQLKMKAKSKRGRNKSRPAQPAPTSNSLIYTSDLYDVAPRGRDGQVVQFQQTGKWRYNNDAAHHLPFPVAEMQARSARNLADKTSPQRKRTRHQWKYRESAASTL